MYNLADYPFEVYPLSVADGGGYLVSYPDFNECIADGDTVEAAIANGREALAATIATLQDKGFAIPAPNYFGSPKQSRISSKLILGLPAMVS